MLFSISNINDFTEALLNAELQHMSLKQREYINAKRKTLFRHQSIASRILLKNLLSEYNIDDGYNIDFDANGKPFYRGSKEIYVSLSHSGDFVAAAVSEKPVGIDIQVFKNVSDRLINKTCTATEKKYIFQNNKNLFFKFWTLKEAYAKCNKMKLSQVFKCSFIDGGVFNIEGCNIQFKGNDLYELAIVEKM